MIYKDKQSVATSFHVYYKARKLENLSDNHKLVPIFELSELRIYLFQIAASAFVLRSPYLKGPILCDESSLGKNLKQCWSLPKDGWRSKIEFYL